MRPVSPREVAVVSPWYPTRELRFRGAFVQAMVEATAPGCDRVDVYHCDAWVARLSPAHDRQVQAAYRAVAPLAVHRTPTVGGAGLFHLPVAMPRGLPFAEQASRTETALRTVLGGAPLAAGVVHAHVGLLGGWAALRTMRPDARLFVTEHATFLDRMLAEPDGKAMYEQVLARSDGFFAVGTGIRELLCQTFPQHADRISIIANPINFDSPRTVPVTRLRRWLYVGGLIHRKGVNWLLEAFAICRAEDPELTLTLVGEGELRDSLSRRAAALGIADAVTFAGAVEPDVALVLMREHDLLVHPSRFETFGVTVVEAVAAGMPVLVTRCGGPEETLAGVEASAGELIEVEDGEAAIVQGYRRLRDRFAAGMDQATARRVLDERYGYPSVARSHYRLWFSED